MGKTKNDNAAKDQQNDDHEDEVGNSAPTNNNDDDEPKNFEDNKPDEAGEEAAEGGKRKRKRKRKKKAADQEDQADADGPEEANDGSSKDMVEHTVYVEGIPFDATPDQVKEFFSSKGEIEDIAELRLPTWQDSGRLRGYGHILFKSSTSFEKALKLSGEHLGKRYLTIQAANTPRNNSLQESSTPQSTDPPPEDCRTLFVNNLPYGAEEAEIAQVFEAAVGVTIPEDGVRIARNSVTRQSKGFCYIDLESPKDAQKIMTSGKRFTVKGRMLRLDWDTGRMKGSYRAESGRLYSKEVTEKKRARVGGRKY